MKGAMLASLGHFEHVRNLKLSTEAWEVNGTIQYKVMVTSHVMKIMWHVMTSIERGHFVKIGPFSTCEVSIIIHSCLI